MKKHYIKTSKKNLLLWIVRLSFASMDAAVLLASTLIIDELDTHIYEYSYTFPKKKSYGLDMIRIMMKYI